MTTSSFKCVGLIGKPNDTDAVESLKTLKAFLASASVTPIIEKHTSAAIPGHPYQTVPLEELGKLCDMIIVVGGDGNMLTAARALAQYDVPLLGINRGRLGFLTDIRPQKLEEELSNVLAGEYNIEHRFLLTCDLAHQSGNNESGNALNDVLVTQGGKGKMIEFEVYIDNQFLCSQRADGIIASTPTGSTAYALSANGPVLHPDLDAIVLVPLCPHTLSIRPIVVGGNSEIRIVVSEHNEIYPKLSCDGQLHFTMAPGDSVVIQKQPQLLKLIHPKHYCYFETLRSKLQWGHKLEYL